MDEKTGRKVRTIAGRLLKRLEKCDGAVWADGKPVRGAVYFGDLFHVGTVADLKALATSALTQAPNKKKPKP